MNNTRKIDLAEIERSYDVEKITLNGECIWPVLRFKYNEALRASSGLKSRTFRLNATLIGKLVKSLYNLWVFSSSDRRKKLGELYVDRVAEPFVSEFENTLMIENPYPLGFHYKKSKIPKSSTLSRIPFFLGIKMIKLLNRKKIKLENGELLSQLYKDTGVTINHQAILKNYLAQYQFMKMLLRIKTPKLVCFVYAASSMGFVKALKEKEVPVVEVQHGIINSMHYAYNYPKDFGKNLTPDYLFTYGEKEMQIFNENNYFIDANAIYPTGYFYIDAINKRQAKEDFKLSLSKRFTKIVVFSLQDPFEEYTFKFLNETARKDPSIGYLLMPRNVHKSYDAYKLEQNLMIIKDLNVYECLQIADFHSTINSTCAIESLYFGVPNILYDFKGWAASYYENILDDNKHTMLVQTPEAFLQVIATHEFYSGDVLIEKSRAFIRRNFSDNIKSVINEKILVGRNE